MSNLMSNTHAIAKKYDPLGYSAVEGATDMDKTKREQAKSVADAKAAAAASEAAGAAAEANRGQQFATRRQENIAAASAAGATRIANDSDLLGAGAQGPKKRYASRVLLGE